MNSLIKRFLSWINSLLGLPKTKETKPRPTTNVPKVHKAPSQETSSKLPKKSTENSIAVRTKISPELRQIVYSSLYDLRKRYEWADLALLGNTLKHQNSGFSVEKYGFSKLSELLENIPDLVEMSVDNRRARLKQPPDLEAFLVRSFNEINGSGSWIHLSSVSQKMIELNSEFAPQKYGFQKFKQFMESRADLIELKEDTSVQPVQYYARLRSRSSLHKESVTPTPKREEYPLRQDAKSAPQESRPKPPKTRPISLLKYAFFPTLNDTYRELAEQALPEQWYFGAVPPRNFQYPILRNYLEYSFWRLQYEGKVAISENGDYSAFNTGLVDIKYEPIHMLFGRDRQGRFQNWYLIGLCVLGEGREGKALSDHFGRLESANYFDQPADMFYDIHAGAPSVNWRHVVEDNLDRLPLSFLQENCPAGFVPRHPGSLSKAEREDYKREFTAALNQDSQVYRKLVARCQSALDFALLKTQLNYRTAVPFYNSRRNRLQLMLPLSLVNDDLVDCALVVDRSQPSSPYIGHTILPLQWAYSNARLISRLEAPWLSSDMTVDSEASDFDDDSELSDEEE